MALFYGWYIVFASFFFMACNSAISIYGFTAFIDPIALAFGWSYTQISLATSLRGIETGALNPLMGIIVDRWPARRLAFIGVCLYGLGLLCLSQISGLVIFYLSFLIMGAGSSLGFSMVPQTTVVKWFKRDVGKATGVLFMGNGVGGMFIPVLVLLIDTYGWRSALISVALAMLVLGIPLSLIFRSSPEQYGLLPDGKKDNNPTIQGDGAPLEPAKTVKDVFFMKAFWLIGIGAMFQAGAMSSVFTHIMPYFSSMGIERSISGLVAMGIPLASLTARIPFGWLSDIFDKRYVRAFSIGLTGFGLLLFWLIDGTSYTLIILFIVVMGLGSGGMMPTLLPVYRYYFGSKHFGKILGLANGFFTIGIITAPPVAGRIFDILGDYDPIWIILCGFATAGTIITLLTPKTE